MAIVTCAQMFCANEFVRPDGRPGTPRLYCDDHRRVKGVTPKLTMKCPVCGEIFDGVATRKFCSLDCRNARQRIEREERRAAARAATEKHCKWCERMLPLTEFRKDAKRLDGLYPYCRDCWREYIGTKPKKPSKWKNRSDYGRDYREANKDLLRSKHRERYLWATYRLTIEQYNQMHQAQNGQCAICNSRNGGAVRSEDYGLLRVDHDHACCPGDRSCGKCVRGLLCHRCNAGIGLMRDDPKILRSAARYLSGQTIAVVDETDGEQLRLIG